MDKSTRKALHNAMDQFSYHGDLYQATPISKGRINETYLLKFYQNHDHRYVIQRLNHDFFKYPQEVADNVTSIAEYLEQKVLERGGDPRSDSINIVYTKDLKPYYVDEDGSYWRSYRYIDGKSLTKPSFRQFYRIGRCYGYFHLDLLSFPLEVLKHSGAPFHDVERRLSHLEKAIAENKVKRVYFAQEEIDSLRELSYLKDILKSYKLPLRVCHNEAIIDNVLTKKKKTVVLDLDTVAPGYLCYDYGDLIRSGCYRLNEDGGEKKGRFDIKLFAAGTAGFLESFGAQMSGEELASLVPGLIYVTYEKALFYTIEYLMGDPLCRVRMPEDNLHRARAQLSLLKQILSKKEALQQIVESL